MSTLFGFSFDFESTFSAPLPIFGYGIGIGPAGGDGAFTTIGKGESSLADMFHFFFLYESSLIILNFSSHKLDLNCGCCESKTSLISFNCLFNSFVDSSSSIYIYPASCYKIREVSLPLLRYSPQNTTIDSHHSLYASNIEIPISFIVYKSFFTSSGVIGIHFFP